jgi:rare lipoprotein A
MNQLHKISGLLLIITLFSLSACTHQTRILGNPDGPPSSPLSPDQIPDAKPRKDPLSKYGNANPYTVLGKSYPVWASSENYAEEGQASWYGSAFHGKPTSSQEPYDMYQVTAAHKHLPIPTYVKVTNLDNGVSAYVRVNDRGPFHADRIIDLSYGAAVKLGVIQKGVARVRVEALNQYAQRLPTGQTQKPSLANLNSTETDSSTTPLPDHYTYAPRATSEDRYISEETAKNGIFLQLGVFSDKNRAQTLAQKAEESGVSVAIQQESRDGGILHRVKLGPVPESELSNLKEWANNTLNIDPIAITP